MFTTLSRLTRELGGTTIAMKTESFFSREDRRWLGRELLSCGLAQREVTGLLGIVYGTLMNDLRRDGTVKELCPGRPDPRDRSAVRATVFAKIALLDDKPVRDKREQMLRDLLFDWYQKHKDLTLLPSREDRSALIYLFVGVLGWPHDTLAELIGVNQATVWQQLRTFGGLDAFPDRPATAGARFNATLRALVNAETGQSPEEGIPHDRYVGIIRRWLRLPEVFAYLIGFETRQRGLEAISYPPEAAGYVRLYLAVTRPNLDRNQNEEEPPPRKVSVERAVENAWRSYCYRFLAEELTWPDNRQDLIRGLAALLVDEERRGAVRPAWQDEDTQLAEAAISALDEQERQVVRELFGIGGRKSERQGIAARMGVTTTTVSNIRRSAFAALRRMPDWQALEDRMCTAADAREQNWGLRATAVKLRDQTVKADALETQIMELRAEIAGMNGTSLDIESTDRNPNLMRRMDELELSVRSANCLQNAGIEYIYQLVEKSEADLLKTKNFGRKSLNEIKDILADLDLRLKK